MSVHRSGASRSGGGGAKGLWLGDEAVSIRGDSRAYNLKRMINILGAGDLT